MRTAFGTFGGSLKTVNPTRMSVIVIEEVLKRAGIQKESVGEVIFGQVLTRTDENNLVSRGAALAAGIPDSVPAHTTINKIAVSRPVLEYALKQLGNTVSANQLQNAVASEVVTNTQINSISAKDEKPKGAMLKENAVTDSLTAFVNLKKGENSIYKSERGSRGHSSRQIPVS